MVSLSWKIYRIGQLSKMIVTATDDKKAKRYARTLRQTTEEIVEMSMAARAPTTEEA